jgi:hypothetical protein
MQLPSEKIANLKKEEAGYGYIFINIDRFSSEQYLRIQIRPLDFRGTPDAVSTTNFEKQLIALLNNNSLSEGVIDKSKDAFFSIKDPQQISIVIDELKKSDNKLLGLYPDPIGLGKLIEFQYTIDPSRKLSDYPEDQMFLNRAKLAIISESISETDKDKQSKEAKSIFNLVQEHLSKPVTAKSYQAVETQIRATLKGKTEQKKGFNLFGTNKTDALQNENILKLLDSSTIAEKKVHTP